MFKLTASALAVLLSCSTAFAQGACGPYPQVATALAGTGAIVFASGRSGMPNGVTEIWVRPDTNEWVAIKIQPTGIACIVDGGHQMTVGEHLPTGVEG